jgi:hypothetical protein
MKRLFFLFILGSANLTGLAGANTVLFDFNSLAENINSTNSEDAIEDYMEALWGSEITVKRGAKTFKSRIEGRPANPFDAYLGNTDGAVGRTDCPSDPACHGQAPDTFLINRWNANGLAANERDRIAITFEEEPIFSVEFDWAIYPVTEGGQNADLTVWADETQIFFTQLLGEEKEKGDLGHFFLNFNGPVRTLQFVDWNDAPIGIDNLRVGRQVPWPDPLLLLAAGLAGPAWWTARKRS